MDMETAISENYNLYSISETMANIEAGEFGDDILSLPSSRRSSLASILIGMALSSTCLVLPIMRTMWINGLGLYSSSLTRCQMNRRRCSTAFSVWRRFQEQGMRCTY